MNAIEMIDHYREKSGDIKASTDQIRAKLQPADSQVFHAVGGLKNPEIYKTLQVDEQSTISSERQYLIIHDKAIGSAVCYLDGKVCFLGGVADKPYFEANHTMRPAVVIESNRVNFYPFGGLDTGTLPVRVTYVREPRPIQFFGGYSVKEGTSHFGQRGKAGLISFDFTWPSERPSVAENELAGGILSVRWGTLRRDYTIEEHSAGQLGALFVNPSYASQEWPTLDLETFTKGNRSEYMAIVHRTSDLPEKYHGMIVDAAVGLPKEEKK